MSEDRYEGKSLGERYIQSQVDQHFSISPFRQMRGQWEETKIHGQIAGGALAIIVSVPIAICYGLYKAGEFVVIQARDSAYQAYNYIEDKFAEIPKVSVICQSPGPLIQGEWTEQKFEIFMPANCAVKKVLVDCSVPARPPTIGLAIVGKNLSYQIVAPNRACAISQFVQG